MHINIAYDSSVTSLNTPGNAANFGIYTGFTSAVQAAVNYFDSEITNNITVTVNFGWGEIGGDPIGAGAIGQSQFSLELTNYASLYAAFQATDIHTAVQQAAVASLPATDPTGGKFFLVNQAEAVVLGLDTSNPVLTGAVGLDASDPNQWSWNQGSVTLGTYDATGVIEHEISEVLGRSASGGTGGTYRPLDLFDYTAAGNSASATPGTAVGARDVAFAGNDPKVTQGYFSFNGSTVTLPFETPSGVTGGADVADWAPSVANDAFADGGVGSAATVSATDLQVLNVLGYSLLCFLPGTAIAVPGGETPVEKLRAGDLVRTADGRVEPVVWIGRGKALATRGQRGPATPVIVQRGALGDGVPTRDLRVTKGHSLYLDGVLIPAEFLVNHRTILWDDRAQEVEVFHIELPNHAVLLANGAPAESYRDDGNRWMFRNANPGWDGPLQEPYAPVLTGGPVVDAVWKRLLDRAGPRALPPLTTDPDLHLVSGGSRIDPSESQDGSLVFRLASGVAAVSVVSRAAVPAELGIARDPRLLGVGLRRIAIRQGTRFTVVRADDSSLNDGFHAFEPATGLRWTDGFGVLPAGLFAGFAHGDTEIVLTVGGTASYLDDGQPARVVAA
jgi:hypothetical protein